MHGHFGEQLRPAVGKRDAERRQPALNAVQFCPGSALGVGAAGVSVAQLLGVGAAGLGTKRSRAFRAASILGTEARRAGP